MSNSKLQELSVVANTLRGFVDAIPDDAVLPAMPGTDRDWVDAVLEDVDSLQDVLEVCKDLSEYIDAIPEKIRTEMPVIDRGWIGIVIKQAGKGNWIMAKKIETGAVSISKSTDGEFFIEIEREDGADLCLVTLTAEDFAHAITGKHVKAKIRVYDQK